MTYLNIDRLSLKYTGQDRFLFSNLSLAIGEGEFVILLGGNGTGKSTLLKLIAGFLKPQKGNIFLKGQSIHRMNQKERAKSISYLNQNVRQSLFFDLTVLENCALFHE